MTNNNTHRMLNLLATVLPRRGAHQLLLAVALVGSGLAVASFSHGVAEADARASSGSGSSGSAAILPTVMLPTVVVRPEPEIPTLATVTVRSGDGSTQNERPTLRVARLLPVHAVTSFASAGSAGSGFGMPYYSFGKPLHHGTEE